MLSFKVAFPVITSCKGLISKTSLSNILYCAGFLKSPSINNTFLFFSTNDKQILAATVDLPSFSLIPVTKST